MGLNVGNLPVTAVYVGSTPVTAVYVGAEKVWPTIEVYEVSLTDVRGLNTLHPLLTVTVPAGETWNVRIQGTITKAGPDSSNHPSFRIGTAESGRYGQGAAVDFSGTATSADSTIAIMTRSNLSGNSVSFVGTVTIGK